VRGLEQDSEPQVYLPYKHRATATIRSMYPKIWRFVQPGLPRRWRPRFNASFAPPTREQPVSNVRTMAKIVEEQTASRTVQARLLAVSPR